MFNLVPGSCFEIGASLSILDNPGKAGEEVDHFATLIKSIIEKIYNTDFGKTQIKIYDSSISLKDHFDARILKALSPETDQIGRCLDQNKSENWLNGEGKKWIIGQLNIASNAPDYSYKNMLTKIKIISDFGVILQEIIPKNQDIAAKLIGKTEEVLNQRKGQITQKIRHAQFDNDTTRARSEKMPIIEGKPFLFYKKLTGKKDSQGIDIFEPLLSIQKTSRGPKGAGFGNVWYAEGMTATDEKGRQLIEKYKQVEQKEGRNGMPRRGQDIDDPNRPGLIGKSTLEQIPEAFEEIKLVDKLKSHGFPHGSGLNRWRLHGSYAIESWDYDFPAAGVHSAATSNFFLALNCLDEESIFGKPKATSTGLIVSSFMNFGGYHSFVETYPIAQAVANNTVFNVAVTSNQKNLYEQILHAAEQSTKEANKEIQKYHHAYKKSVRVIAENKQSTPENTKSKDDLDITYPSRKHYK